MYCSNQGMSHSTFLLFLYVWRFRMFLPVVGHYRAEIWVRSLSDLALGMAPVPILACRLVAGLEIFFLSYHEQFRWHPDSQGLKVCWGAGGPKEMAQLVKALPGQGGQQLINAQNPHKGGKREPTPQKSSSDLYRNTVTCTCHWDFPAESLGVAFFCGSTV